MSSVNEENTSIIPTDNANYSTKEYWDDRYTTEDSYEWLIGYKSIRNVVKRYVKETDKVLMLGCGNSPLSADMYKDGFHHITNIDYSSTCISRMSAKHGADMPEMSWMEMDARALSFEDGSFDVVVEKATLDAFMTTETNPWVVSEETRQIIDQTLTEVSRVLRTGGHFLSITFAQKQFRLPLYAQAKYDWSLSNDTIPDGFFPYNCFTMTKGGQLTTEQIDHAERFLNLPDIGGGDEVLVQQDGSDEDVELAMLKINL